MKETEYKFIVDKIPPTKDKTYISQYYIEDKEIQHQILPLLEIEKNMWDKIETVRVRKCVSMRKETYYLTAKTGGDFTRDEYEIKIPKNLAEKFIKHSNKKIQKIRSVIWASGLKFEFDFYYTRPDKLKICEIEVQNTQNYDKILNIFENLFKIKAKDVTFDNNYKNFNLARSEKNERNI